MCIYPVASCPIAIVGHDAIAGNLANGGVSRPSPHGFHGTESSSATTGACIRSATSVAGAVASLICTRQKKELDHDHLPMQVEIHEEGPREGFQIAPGPISTADKIRLIEAQAET
jgi:hypothetical protein